MIYFVRDGTDVQAVVETGLPIGAPKLAMVFKTNSELSAELLERHLRAQLEIALRAIRTEAYNAGWREAKAKKTARKRNFSGSISPIALVGW